MTVKRLVLSPFLTLLLILSLTPTAKAQDSLQSVPVPKYVLSRMAHDIKLGRLCDELAHAQQGVIERAFGYIESQDSLIQIRGQQIENLTQENKVWEQRYLNQVEVTKEEKKVTKKWKIGTILGGGLIILLLL